MKSKILLLALFFGLYYPNLFGQTNPNFYLASNGITCMCPNATVGETGTLNGVVYTKRIKAQITTENAATTCTSGIKDMSSLFKGQSEFNGDISSWDVSSVTNMTGMFWFSTSFNQPIGNWDVSKVTNMSYMFNKATTFNQPIDNWNVGNVVDMTYMFNEATLFNQYLWKWCVTKIISKPTYFSTKSSLSTTNMPKWGTCPISNANFYLHANGVTCMCPDAAVGETGLITGKFDGVVYTKRTRDQITIENAATTCTSGITDMSNLFKGQSTFNEKIGSWDVSNVTNMSSMFFSASSFNQPIGNWDVSKVTNMEQIFLDATVFNQPLSNWDVSSVTNMASMFYVAKAFNQPIGNWNVSKVMYMSGMFSETTFNQPISNWDVSSVTNMGGMFYGASLFNQPIGNWDVSKVTNMSDMFFGAKSFNQSIENWNIKVTGMRGMFAGALSFNQPIGNWDVSNVIDMSGIFSGASSFNQPLSNWDVSSVTNMGGMFAGALSFNQPIGNWNVSNVINMSNMFSGASSFNQPIDSWNVSSVTNMSQMFNKATAFSQSIGNWNVSNVTNMPNMFFGASSFNQPIGNWDVSSVTNMQQMFEDATTFNQSIMNWNVSSVINMDYMFRNAISFNQPVGGWNVSNVKYMKGMFFSAAIFNQNLNNWCITKISSEPIDFSRSSSLVTDNKPKWGTCPKPIISISGKSTVCRGENNVVYTVPIVNNATSYVWTLPSGAIGSSTSNSISVNFGLNSTSGKIIVKALNNSVEINSSSLDVIVNSKPTVGLITGATNVIQGQQGVNYSINSVSNATSYIWTLPTGATGTSNTNSIKINFGATAQSGNISVKAINSCGESEPVSIFVEVVQSPNNIGAISGKSIVCNGENNVVYTVPVVNNASSYVWTLPSGVIGSSTTNRINVNFGSNSISGNISVKAVNIAGESKASIFYVKVNNKPLNSAEIVGEKLVTQGQKDVIYTITEIPSVTSYIWSLPVGATGVSNTNSIKVSFDQTFISGNISVYAKNDCGTSSPSTLKIEVMQPVFSKISIIGDAVKDWFTDVDLTTEDGVIYNILGQKLFVGGIKFRQDYTWTKRWGGSTFPSGTGVEDDSNIMVNQEGIYDISFNLNTLDYNFIIKTLGLDDFNNASNVSISPNPTTNQLTLTHTEAIKKANVYNYLGQLVLSQNGAENTMQLNVGNLSNGNYLVKIESTTETQTVKFVKE